MAVSPWRATSKPVGRHGEQGLILEPRLVLAVLKPTIQPEIVTGGEHRRTVKRARQDVVLDLAEARSHIMPIGRLVGQRWLGETEQGR